MTQTTNTLLESILAAGFCLDETAYPAITNLDVVYVLTRLLTVGGISVDPCDLERLLNAGIQSLKTLEWTAPVEAAVLQELDDIATEKEALSQILGQTGEEQLHPPDIDIEPDEGPLVEQYENSSRLHDDDWLEAAYEDGVSSWSDDF